MACQIQETVQDQKTKAACVGCRPDPNGALLSRFLPKYSGGQVIKIIKSISGKRVFEEAPEIKAELWGGEFWRDGYYIATISGKGNKEVIEKYIKNQGREKDLEQLWLFEV